MSFSAALKAFQDEFRAQQPPQVSSAAEEVSSFAGENIDNPSGKLDQIGSYESQNAELLDERGDKGNTNRFDNTDLGLEDAADTTEDVQVVAPPPRPAETLIDLTD
ncbi:unnamed protein product, partial [Choristocarpus tenellus]